VTGAAIGATTAGVIALVVGLLLVWKNDRPRVRLALLIAGSTTVTGGVWGRFAGSAADTIETAASTATATVTGTAVGLVGVVVLGWIILRDVIAGTSGSRVTDAAALVTPPVAAAAGGFVAALCLLVAAVVQFLIQLAWGAGAFGVDLIQDVVTQIGR
jgi:hypothetical protein